MNNGFEIINSLNDLAKELKGECDVKRWLIQSIVEQSKFYENDNSDYARGFKDCLTKIRKELCTMQPKNETLFDILDR